MAQLVEVQRLPDTSSTGGRAPRSARIQANLRSLSPHLNTTLRRRPQMTSVHTQTPHDPDLFAHLKNRSEGEVNIFQGFEVNQSVSATLLSFFQPFSLHSSRRGKKVAR